MSDISHHQAYEDVRSSVIASMRTRLSALQRAVSDIVSGLKTDYARFHQLRTDRDAFLNLLTLDDRQLDDIGVTRDEVIWASELPLDRNAALELDALKKRRRSAGAAR